MKGFSQVEVLLLLKLILAHGISDFALQPAKWVDDRIKRTYKSRYLYLHVAVTGAITWLLTQNWVLTVIITITHFLIDLCKSYSRRSVLTFIADQTAHLLVIVACWLYMSNGRLAPEVFLSNYQYMVYLTGYFMASFPLSVVIKICTAKWGTENRQKDIRTFPFPDASAVTRQETQREEERWDELKEAGRWIGIIERVLVITFVLLDQYEAIGLLIAGKSIIRFKESDQRKSEYFLFGTLLSISFSIFLALAMKVALQYK